MIFNSEEQEHRPTPLTWQRIVPLARYACVWKKRCPGDVLDRAAGYFHKLGMDKTALRNGVLIYLSTEDHQFAIIGDKGIHEKVGDGFWDGTKNLILEHFQQNEIVPGLIAGIGSVGKQLKTFFPRKDDDINELPNEVFFGDSK